MTAVDEPIPASKDPRDKPFLLPVEHVFSSPGRGVGVTGRIETGVVKVGEDVEIVGLAEEILKAIVAGIEILRKPLDQGQAGDTVDVLLSGVGREDVERGQVLAKPGSIEPHEEFKSDVYVLTKEEGGRHTPFFANYRPQFYFRTIDVTGTVTLPEGTEMVMPGDSVTLGVKLIAEIAMNVGQRFTIRENTRIVGRGIVTEIGE